MRDFARIAGVICLLGLTTVTVWQHEKAQGAEPPTPAGNTLVGWGLDEFGETDVPDGSDFVAVSAGESYSLALRSDGSLAGWGFNQFGQTGVPAGNDYVSVSAGFAHAVALRLDGSLVAWGGKTFVPVDNDFVAAAAGGAHSLAIRADGSLVGWGGWNWFGETIVPSGNDYVQVAAGFFHSLALRADGTLAGWGSNLYGLTTVPAGDDFVAIAAGYYHNLALRADGSLVGWGWNEDGQAEVPEGNDFIAIAAGYAHSVALRADGSLVGWGWSADGSLDVPEGNDFVAIAAGAAHNLAIRSPTVPLEIQATTDVTSIWPPNHKMVPVTITAEILEGDPAPENLLIWCWVSSSQPDDTNGSGKHTGDVNGQDGFTAPVAVDLQYVDDGRYQATILLRAERDGNDKDGRIYSIVVEAWNPTGSSSLATCEVLVPHNRGKGSSRR